VAITADTAIVQGARGEPRRGGTLLPSAVIGTLLFVFTEAMLFAGLISAHAIVRASAQEWPPTNQPRLPFAETMVNTAALLASGVLLIMAHVSYRKRAELARVPLLIALLLGSCFVLFQGREWVALLGQGLTPTSSTYGGFFYVIVGTHALHAVAAILAMAWAWRRLNAGKLTAAQFGAVEIFWYFVVLVWPVLYLRVYL
jgi:heme/copper-type cytochrome/quinol oxidase subunit 3